MVQRGARRARGTHRTRRARRRGDARGHAHCQMPGARSLRRAFAPQRRRADRHRRRARPARRDRARQDVREEHHGHHPDLARGHRARRTGRHRIPRHHRRATAQRLRLAALRARPRRSACARPAVRRGRRARVQHDDDARELRRQGVPLQGDGAHRHRSGALRGHVHDGGDAHRARRRRAGAAPGAARQQQVGRGDRARDHRRFREDRDRRAGRAGAHRHNRAPSGQARAGHAARHDRHPRRWTRVHLDRA